MLDDFPVIIDIPVQWGDQDALGHVNNVVFFRWWESSRVAYCERAGLIRRQESSSLLPPSVSTVLASIQCDFRRQLVYPDRVRVGARLARIGNSSIRIEHRLVSETLRAIAAEAVSTIVMFDFEAQRSLPVPAELRAAMQALEPGRKIEGL